MPANILVVDDDTDDCELLAEVINELGWNGSITFSHSGSDALQYLESIADTNKLPSLVILDVNLPGINGIDVLKKIKASYPDIQVLMYSTTCSSEMVSEVKANGAIDCMTKASTHAQQLKFGRHILSLIAPHPRSLTP